MHWRENMEMSLHGLQSHRLRSFLTILGIIFGVAAVVAMLSIGAGAKQEALDQIKLLGVNNVIIRSEPIIEEADERGEVLEAGGISLDDTRSLLILNPLVSNSVPQKELPETRVRSGSNMITTTVVGTTPTYQEVLQFYPIQGSFFNFIHLHENQRVCVLGQEAKQRLFLFEDPIGKEIKIENVWFKVLGVMEPKPRSTGKGGVGDRNLNMDIYIPLSSALIRYEYDPTTAEVDQVILQVADENLIQEAASLARSLLLLRHNNAQDFRIVIPEELLRQSMQTQRIFNIVMGAIAGISLLVGGIGIMNIMLATVMERTREIGVRRAVGATRRDILSQFLFEAVLLSFSGGLLGIFLGFLMAKVISSYADWKTIVEWTSIVLAFTVSASVGIIFGIYPARKAAYLDPIDSLRYE